MSDIEGLTGLRDLHRQIQRERKIKIDISKTQYPLFRNIAINQLGWKIWGKQDQRGEVNLFWNDTYVSEENVKRLKPYQRINHFPNSQELGKKNLLSDNLRKMKALMPNQYNFFPQTWSMPQQEEQLKQNMQTKKWLIVKPSSSSQGKGIFLTRDINAIPKENSVVQEYIPNPHLIDGCKYDLRIYVLIKSLVPLKIFRFEEGLTRLATHPYETPNKHNKKNMNMHLTNYAINKLNPAYVQNKDIEDDSIGHKRSLASAYKSLAQDGCNISRLKQQIDEVISKTILSCYPKMLESYKNCRDCEIEGQSVCFQILGIDILIDQNFKPWLIESNHSPSFCTQSPLDFIIKKYLVLDTLILLNLKCEDKEMFLKNRVKDESQKNIIKDKDAAKIKRSAQTIFENKHLGGFKKIYPSANSIYTEILKKIYSRKLSSKFPPKLHPTKQKQSVISLEKKTVQSSPIRKRNQNPYFTFYGQFEVLRGKRQQYFDQQDLKQDQVIKRHISFQREKKKNNEPMKMNNVSISFIDDMKTHYQNGFQSRSTSNNAHRPMVGSIKGQSLQAHSNESKTSEGNRKQIKMLDYEIRSRIGKMKLARIKLQKIKSIDRRDEPNSTRIMRQSQKIDQMRSSSKII